MSDISDHVYHKIVVKLRVCLAIQRITCAQSIEFQSCFKDACLDYTALWESICKWSRKAGRAATRPVLIMWYVMRDKNTPRKDKWAIFASLAYLILPIDILDAKRLPIIGWLDEVASLAVLVQKISKYITPEMEARADEQLDKWFNEFRDYEIIV